MRTTSNDWGVFMPRRIATAGPVWAPFFRHPQLVRTAAKALHGPRRARRVQVHTHTRRAYIRNRSGRFSAIDSVADPRTAVGTLVAIDSVADPVLTVLEGF